MSQDYIHTLPIEVLTECFDLLTFKKQLEIMSTCYRWYDILTDKRYLRSRRFCIRMDNIRCLDVNGGSKLCNVKQIQRYKAFRISNASISTEQTTEYLEAVRLFLSRKQVMNNVEDLLLDLNGISLANLFSNSQHWSFPKLERIIDCGTTTVQSDDKIFINAPNLRRLKMVASQVTVSPLVQRFSSQIEEFSMNFVGRNLLYNIIESTRFTRLNSLTLVSGYVQDPENSEFYDTSNRQRQVFGQLKYLKICDHYAKFNTILKNILRAAKNLETLIVIGTQISSKSFNAINCIRGLKKLCVLVKVFEQKDVNGLSLPELERLTTYADAFTPLRSVPKLRWLTLKKHSWKLSGYGNVKDDSLHTALHPICQQLETLHLVEMNLYVRLVQAIQDFENLKSLEMRLVQVQVADICTILSMLPSLRHFSVVCSNLVKIYELDWCTMQGENLTDGERRDFFKKLRLEHPSTRIDDIDNNYKRYFRQLQLERSGNRPSLE